MQCEHICHSVHEHNFNVKTITGIRLVLKALGQRGQTREVWTVSHFLQNIKGRRTQETSISYERLSMKISGEKITWKRSAFCVTTALSSLEATFCFLSRFSSECFAFAGLSFSPWPLCRPISIFGEDTRPGLISSLSGKCKLGCQKQEPATNLAQWPHHSRLFWRVPANIWWFEWRGYDKKWMNVVSFLPGYFGIPFSSFWQQIIGQTSSEKGKLEKKGSKAQKQPADLNPILVFFPHTSESSQGSWKSIVQWLQKRVTRVRDTYFKCQFSR